MTSSTVAATVPPCDTATYSTRVNNLSAEKFFEAPRGIVENLKKRRKTRFFGSNFWFETFGKASNQS